MGTGYTRNDTSNNIADGNIINASDLDGEFDAIESALSTSGHTHDGTSAEGGPVTVVGPAQDLVVSASEVKPKTDNTLDLGTASLQFKNAYFQGTVDTDGIMTAATFEPDGDTAAGDNAAIGFTAAEGLILTGQGSTNDVTIKNDADTEVMGVATGGTVVDFASGPTVADVAIKVAGKESIWVPAGAMYASTTNGCSALTQVETTALRPDLKVLDFAADADDFAQFAVAFPKSWNEGTITYQCFWTPSTTNTGNCIFGLQGVAVGDGDTIDVAFGTAVNITDAGIGTVEDQQVSPVSSAVTIAGSPAVDQQTYFQIFRDANAGGDTYTGVARLLGIKIFFTTDAANDA